MARKLGLKWSFCAIYIYKRTLYQDRLGTNIGKTPKKEPTQRKKTEEQQAQGWVDSGLSAEVGGYLTEELGVCLCETPLVI